MRKHSSAAVLIVGPITLSKSHVGGIDVLLRSQLAHWELPVSVAHFNTELWPRDSGTTGQFRFKHILSFMINTFRLSREILRRRPSVVHYHTSIRLALLKDMLLAGMARWIFGCKVIMQIHSAVAGSILLTRSRFVRGLQLHLLMACSDRVVFLSLGVINEMTGMLNRTTAARLLSKATILPNFTVLPDARQCHVDSTDPVNILFIGRIGQPKGIYDLVRATHQVAARCAVPFEVVCAGPFDSPEDERRIAGLVQELGLYGSVKFSGPVAGQAKVEAFLKADIFVLPSYTEGVPLSMIEAMAYALPVVVTDVGGIPETVTDGCEGFVLRPGQIETLAAALCRLITEPERRRQMGRAGYVRAERCYSVKAYFDALRNLYYELGILTGGTCIA